MMGRLNHGPAAADTSCLIKVIQDAFGRLAACRPATTRRSHRAAFSALRRY